VHNHRARIKPKGGDLVRGGRDAAGRRARRVSGLEGHGVGAPLGTRAGSTRAGFGCLWEARVGPGDASLAGHTGAWLMVRKYGRWGFGGFGGAAGLVYEWDSGDAETELL